MAEIVSREELAKRLGYSNPSSLSQLKKEGLELVELKRGEYDFCGCVLNYAKFMQQRLDKRSATQPSGSNIDPLAAARKLTGEADIAEIAARKAARDELIEAQQVVYIDDVIRAVSTDLSEVQQRCQRWMRQWLKKIKASPQESERYNNEFIEFWNSLCDRPWSN